MGRRFVLALVALLVATCAYAEGVIIELSQDRVSVDASFTGTSITLFGVINRDAQTVARPGEYHIAITVQGPSQTVAVQRMDRVFGIWTSVEERQFKLVPSFFAVLTTDNFPPDVARELRDDRSAPRDGSMPERAERFRQALLSRRLEEGLYFVGPDAIEKISRNLFRANIRLPGEAQDGSYVVTAQIYTDGVVLGETSTTFIVEKVGIEARIYQLSRSSPLIYGLSAVALALVTGYLGGVIFRRN